MSSNKRSADFISPSVSLSEGSVETTPKYLLTKPDNENDILDPSLDEQRDMGNNVIILENFDSGGILDRSGVSFEEVEQQPEQKIRRLS